MVKVTEVSHVLQKLKFDPSYFMHIKPAVSCKAGKKVGQKFGNADELWKIERDFQSMSTVQMWLPVEK